MIRLKKLYSTPEMFTPIVFEPGLNFILGERSESNNKTNGVGKSICIEFINYCLLKKSSESRVKKIPEARLPKDSTIFLDLMLDDRKITISRRIDPSDIIEIATPTSTVKFENLEDAILYLTNIQQENLPISADRISFRNMIAPLLRDEKSEFKDIIRCFDTQKRIPPDFSPHLYFLGLDVGLYSEIKHVIDEYNKKTAFVSETKKILTRDNEVKISDVRARLNELEFEVKKINAAIEELKSFESFESVQIEIINLELRADILRTRQKAIKVEMAKIKKLPEPEVLSESEITMLFNQFASGLGDAVKKSLDEVKVFKARVDTFRNQIVNEKFETLKTEISTIETELRLIDVDYSEKISLLDKGKILHDLKTSVNVYSKKNEELNNLRSLLERFDYAEKEKKKVKTMKESKTTLLDDNIYTNQEIIKDFEKTILEAHEYIIGNREAHFGIRTIEKGQSKDVVSFDLRIDDDGSWSTERLKVFMYDISLLLNRQTKVRHPLFLVHDNIFNVDNDSLEKCLNYIYSKSIADNNFQYILTLNRDMVESLELRKSLIFQIEDYRRAFFTKDDRFLRMKYAEKEASGS
jgi:uncharacterized protein YydD (DUF2326 family)